MTINTKILDFNIKNDLNVILLHHYFATVREETITLRQLERKIGMSIQKIRTALDKLEEAGIIEVVKGTPTGYTKEWNINGEAVNMGVEK